MFPIVGLLWRTKFYRHKSRCCNVLTQNVCLWQSKNYSASGLRKETLLVNKVYQLTIYPLVTSLINLPDYGRHVTSPDLSLFTVKGGAKKRPWIPGCTSELNFHIWSANWPMKREAKLAAHGGQFCTSVLVPYAVLYVSFSLPRDFYTFLKSFLGKYTQNISLKDRNEFKNFKCISRMSNQVTGNKFLRK